jgi:hypothetical protein
MNWTAHGTGDAAHCKMRQSRLRVKAVGAVMSLSGPQMNRFERVLFRVALVLAVTLITVRVGAMLLTWYLHHVR